MKGASGLRKPRPTDKEYAASPAGAMAIGLPRLGHLQMLQKQLAQIQDDPFLSLAALQNGKTLGFAESRGSPGLPGWSSPAAGKIAQAEKPRSPSRWVAVDRDADRQVQGFGRYLQVRRMTSQLWLPGTWPRRWSRRCSSSRAE
jgi:hypothetical protein